MILALLAACAPTDPTLAIGGGVTSFEPMADGADLVLVAGPQGGHHVWTSLKATDITPGDPLNLGDPDNPIVDLQLLVDDVMVGGFAQLPRGFTADGEAWVLLGQTVILTGLDPEAADGVGATLRGVLRDAGGAELSAEVSGTLRLEAPPPADEVGG